MRLDELINFDPKSSKHDIGSYGYKLDTKTRAEPVGSGSFGTAYDTKSNKRLNQVTKVGKAATFQKGPTRLAPVKSIEDDGYLAYISAVQKIQQGEHNNPYFPVVHDLKIRKNAEGHLSYKIDLEKLYNFETPKIIESDEVMKALCDRMFAIESPDDGFADHILYCLRTAKKNPRIIQDENLNDALRLIYEIVEQRNGIYILDLSEGNIMWRITGTIPQLVIIDPIA